MNRMLYLSLVVATASGCFDSLVSDRCASGYAFVGGQCLAREAPDGGATGGADASHPDGTMVVETDAAPGPDALVCTAPDILCSGTCIDVSSDPNNCGACGHVCASGICQMSHCVGDLSGQIVAIGHDYSHHHPAMVRVLGNAVALGAHADVGVARWHGSAGDGDAANVSVVLAQGMAQVARAWHPVPLPALPSASALDGVDVLVVEPQRGAPAVEAASAAPWAGTLDLFLQRGGVVVVLEGAGGVSYKFAEATNLFTVPAPADATAQQATIVDSSDAIAQQVVSPYLAETTSVGFAGVVSGSVITTPAGTVVLHQTRY